MSGALGCYAKGVCVEYYPLPCTEVPGGRVTEKEDLYEHTRESSSVGKAEEP
jgi:hypothetical protein